MARSKELETQVEKLEAQMDKTLGARRMLGCGGSDCVGDIVETGRGND